MPTKPRKTKPKPTKSTLVKSAQRLLIPIEVIENKIFILRGRRVMLDRDLAKLYGAETRVLNQAVIRNSGRFPDDFMFELTSEEGKAVCFQDHNL